jgi:putative membrane protein
VFDFLKALREGAVPVLVLIVVGSDGLGRALLYLVGGTVAATVVAVVRWRTTEWRVTGAEVRRRAGVLGRQERSVPLARVQSIDAVQGPLQRLFGVETLRVQSGGGRGSEVVLTAVTPAQAGALRAAVTGVAGEEVVVADPDGPVRRLARGELLLAAVTAGQVGAVAAVGGALAPVVNEVLDPSAGRLEALERLAPETAAGWTLVVAAALALSWLIAIAGAVVAFSGFTLLRDGDRLRLRRGLLARRDSAVPVRRVQAVRVVEGVLRQPFGLASVRIETLGYGDEPPANQTLFPLVRRRELPELLATFLPEHAVDLGPVTRPPARALGGYAVPPAVLAGIAVVAAVALVDVPWWTLAVVLPAAGWGVLQWRAAGWRLGDGGAVVLRGRRLARSTLLLCAGRVQVAQVGRSPLQLRAGLATVELSVGPATGRLRGLEAGTAWRLWSAVRPAPGRR